ncbi:FadR/GntR family transcriptional regulator [Mesorhizobium sp. IMUNJ 23232]|uniref:FadR/GntR family transcriptional regulator n=1 Tax=Mesorhizobium sp. IMUNJ 23232 TaxID=3376064 RepID=UPI0037A42CFD
MGLLQTVISGQKLRTNHAHIVDSLGRDIVSGSIPSGEILPGDSELMARFGVSRTVLREALKTLAAKGLIVPRARIGTRVTSRESWSLFDPDILNWHFEAGIDEAFLVHLSEIRLAFEPYAAGLAAERATKDDVVMLQQLADTMGETNHSAESHAMADLRFHLAVAEASRNPFMRSVGSLIEAALVGVFKLSSPSADLREIQNAQITHRRIVDAIRRRDVEEARAAMEAVIINGVERVRLALRAAN